MESEEIVKNLTKIWILYFIFSSINFFLKNGEEEVVLILIMLPFGLFLALLFDYIFFLYNKKNEQRRN